MVRTKEADEVASMLAAIEAKDWEAAGERCDRLRSRGWTYQRCAALVGGVERWEEIAQAMDEADAGV